MNLKYVAVRGKPTANASAVGSRCSTSGGRVRLVRTTQPRPEPEECDGSAVTGPQSTTTTAGPCCDSVLNVDPFYGNLTKERIK